MNPIAKRGAELLVENAVNILSQHIKDYGTYPLYRWLESFEAIIFEYRAALEYLRSFEDQS